MSVTNYNRRIEIARGLKKSGSHIWAVGGGKGGVGKSFVSSGLAILLANLGYKTLLIDLDLGAANLHTYLGMTPPDKCLQDVIFDKSFDLNKVVTNTPIENLSLISGHSDKLHVTDLSTEQKSNLMAAIYHYKTDFIIMDLSAGTHKVTLDLFNTAQKHIIVSTPEPVSIENAYTFMKEAFYRKLKRIERQHGLEETLAELMAKPKEYGINTPGDLLFAACELEPEKAGALKSMIDHYGFHILINQARTYKDSSLGTSIQSVCTKYFGIPAEHIGSLDFDNGAWQALRNNQHLLISYPHSRVYGQLFTTTRNLVKTTDNIKAA